MSEIKSNGYQNVIDFKLNERSWNSYGIITKIGTSIGTTKQHYIREVKEFK